MVLSANKVTLGPHTRRGASGAGDQFGHSPATVEKKARARRAFSPALALA